MSKYYLSKYEVRAKKLVSQPEPLKKLILGNPFGKVSGGGEGKGTPKFCQSVWFLLGIN